METWRELCHWVQQQLPEAQNQKNTEFMDLNALNKDASSGTPHVHS